MPDKPLHDQDWIDQGWQDMARRLDEAMPVKAPRRRRRLLLWWWSAAGLALLLGVAWLWYTQRTAPLAQQPVVARNATDPVATNQLSTTPAATTKSDVAHASKHLQLSSTAPLPMRNPPGASLSRPRAAKVTPQSASAEDVFATAVDASSSLAPPITTAPPNPTLTTTEELAPTTLPVAALPTRPATKLVTTTDSYSLTTLDPRASAAWSVWAVAGINQNLGQRVGGLGGLAVSTALGNRWQLQLGLQYESRRQVERPSAETSATMDEALLSNGPTTIFFGDNAYRAAYQIAHLQPLTSHWLTLPVQLRGRVGRRWQLSGSLGAAYLLRARAPRAWDAYLAPADFDRNANMGIEAADLNDRVNFLPAQRWKLDAGLGVHYRLHPRWQVAALLRSDLTRWYGAAVPDLVNQQWQVNVQYRLRR